MQRNIYTDDFERLIRQKADQYKMYPSDQVWKGIYQSLHGRRRWRWAGLAIFLVGIGVFTGNWYLTDKPAQKLAKNIEPSISAANQFSQAPTSSAPFRWTLGSRTTPKATATGTNPRAVNTGIGVTAHQQVNPNTGRRSDFLAQVDNATIASSQENSQVITNGNPEQIALLNPSMLNKERSEVSADEDIAGNKAIAQKAAQTLADNGQAEKALDVFADASSESVSKENKLFNINWLEEYAVFKLTPPKAKRLGLQLYFSPTVNYRKLTGSSYYPASELKSIPLSPNIVGDVDQYVKHRPALGLELGANLLYRTSKRVNLKAGFQFNYSRYEIEAYTGMPEIATIALNNQTFINDTISSYSRIRNLSGYAPEDLSNQYFQLSLPIGLEYKVIGGSKLELHVAGTIQPTYLLNRNSYLITTDYKNYMREPSLVRRWNLNGGLETYVSYYTGTVRWQVGPQFRYQLLSTYSRKYPIKEQLMEYGVKIGVSKTIR